MKQKRIICKIVLAIAFVATIFSSTNAFAQTFTEKMVSTHNYKGLLKAMDMLEITEHCQNYGPTNLISGNFSYYDSDNDTTNATTGNLYSNYLDNDNPKDGAFHCGNISSNAIITDSPARDLISTIDGGTSSDIINKLICGKNNDNTGIYRINFFKTSNSSRAGLITPDFRPDGTPDWIKVDEDGYATNCFDTVNKLRSLYTAGESIGNGITAQLIKNRSYSDYYKDELSIDNNVLKTLNAVRLYLNITKNDKEGNICYLRQVSKDLYDLKGGSAYAIKNPITDKTEYWLPDSSGKFDKNDYGSSSGGWSTTNIRQNLTADEHISCKKAIEELVDYSESGTLDVLNIKNCYNKAQENIEKLKSIATKLNSVVGKESERLIQVAKDLADGKELPSYSSGPDRTFLYVDNGISIYWTIMNDETLSKSDAAKNFADLSKEFSNLVIDYNNKTLDGSSLSSTEIENLRQKISNYESSRDVFKKNIVNQIDDSLSELPNVNINSMYQNYDGISNLDNTIRPEVENFYKLDDEGNVTCIYNDKVNETREKMEEILGASIDFQEYVQNQAEEDGTNDSDGDACYDAGIEGMSWVLCPLVNNTAQTVDGIEKILNGWLQIKEDDLFNNDVYRGWRIFRNIANTLLIIVLLVVIFSQLTGVGIDNYGIKKMLPRIIVMAILINLSYLMCQLAVEISNILGVGLDNMMKSIGTYIAQGDPSEGLGAYEVVGILFGILAGAGAIAGVAVGSGGGVMLVISLVLALLVALVAVLIFFVMLGARMVIVAVFTVIAPVAFVLYILPSTQGLFKKWWKVFQAALVVYPICGALYGASYIIKAIIGSGDGNLEFFQGLTAIIAPFLPFLVLPTLLKSALAGLGALGGVFATLGSGLRKGLSSGGQAVQKSERLQDFNTRWMAGYKKDGTTKKDLNGLQRFLRGGRRSVQSNALRYQKVQSERGAREATEGEDFMLATATANKAKYIEASGEINDNGRLQAGLQRALRDKDRAAIRAYTDALSNKGENGREIVGKVWNDYTADRDKMSAVSAKTFADNIMANHSMEYKNNDRAMFDIAKNINNVEGRRQDDKGNYTESQDSYDRRIKNAVQSRANYVATQKVKLTESVSANTIGTMDDYAFDELFNPSSGTDDKDLGKIVYEAIHGANAANIKEKRMKTLRSILENSKYTPDVQNVRVVKDGES